MHDLYDNLEQLCKTVADEINEANGKIKSAGGKISAGDIDYLDKLTHMLKSIKTTKAMMDAEDGYSSASYARGRRGNVRRDSMGRYSRDNMPSYMDSYDNRVYTNRAYEGRSYDDDMVAELHELMEDAPNAKIRQKFQQFISEIESMK